MAALSIIAKMASRNVLKYRKRSLQTFTVVFIGVAAIAIADAFMNGFSDRIVAQFAVAEGHLRVSAPGYSARRATCPLDRLAPDPDALASRMEAAALSSESPSAAGRGRQGPFAGLAVLPLLRAPCAIQLGEKSVNAYVVGAEAYLPDDGLAPPFRSSQPAEGSYPRRGERGAVLSAKLASRLGVSVGDTLILLASDAFGSFGAVELPLVGVTRFDPGPASCHINLGAMRELVGVDTGASEVAAYLVDRSGAPVDPRLVAPSIQAALAAARAEGLEAEAWDSSSSSLPGMLAFFDSFVLALYAIFAIVASAGIANTVLLSVQDRTRDFGTLRAVAFPAAWVQAIVALETLLVGFAASVSAALVSGLAIASFGPEGLRIPPSVGGIAEWMPESIAARVDPASLVLVVLGGSLLPLLAAAVPLRLLAKMKIREALGYA